MKKQAVEVLKNRWVQLIAASAAGFALCFFTYPSKKIEEQTRRAVSATYEEKIEKLEKEHSRVISSLEKTHKQTLSMVDEEHRSKTRELSSKVDKLQEENRSLKSSTTTEWIKITKPDGTIEERKVSKKEMEALSQTVTRIQEESNKKLREEQDRLREEKRKEVASVSEKLSLEISSLKETIIEREEQIKKLETSSKVTTINERKLSVGLGIDTDLTYSGTLMYTIFGPVWIGARIDVTPSWLIPRGALMIGVSF